MDSLDDSGSSKHGGYEEKEVRRKRRVARLEKAGRAGGLAAKSKRVAADPEYVFLLFSIILGNLPKAFSPIVKSR